MIKLEWYDKIRDMIKYDKINMIKYDKINMIKLEKDPENRNTNMYNDRAEVIIMTAFYQYARLVWPLTVSDGKAPLWELWRVWNTSSLPLLPGLLWVSVRDSSVG